MQATAVPHSDVKIDSSVFKSGEPHVGRVVIKRDRTTEPGYVPGSVGSTTPEPDAKVSDTSRRGKRPSSRGELQSEPCTWHVATLGMKPAGGAKVHDLYFECSQPNLPSDRT